MSDSHCPLCYTPLETRDVAPCYDCGHDPSELIELAQGRHTYEELETLGARIVLCEFCQSDFSSYDPRYFGLLRGTRVGRPSMQLVRALPDPRPGVDKYCPQCRRRLAFLRFVDLVRSRSSASARRPTIAPLPSGFFERWDAWFPGVPAVGFLLRDADPDRWLRIHSLPDSKRYAESGTEHAEILRRHNEVATDMLGEGSPCVVLVLSSCEGRDASSVGRDSGLTDGALPRVLRLPAQLWDDDTGSFVRPMCLFGGATTWRSGAFDAFITAAADDRVSGLVVSLETGAVYAPYDGGADLLFASSWERDVAHERYAGWLSAREDGL